jgi:hypothetical protein
MRAMVWVTTAGGTMVAATGLGRFGIGFSLLTGDYNHQSSWASRI